MQDEITYEELTETRYMLQQMLEEINELEAPLAGDSQKLGPCGAEIEGVLDTIYLGTPHANLSRLTEKRFKEFGVELNSIRREQMKVKYDFYYMTLAVSMIPLPDSQFSRVVCRLDFEPKGKSEPIVESIFPKSEWKDLLHCGVQMQVGLNGDLKLSARIPDNLIQNLPDEIKANANAGIIGAFKTSIEIPEYRYELGKSEIVAVGEENSFCFWRIEKPDLKKKQTVQFGVVFKVPKDTTSIKLTGRAWADTNSRWILPKVKRYFKKLSDSIQEFFTGEKPLPIGVVEAWNLELPKG